MIRHLTPCDGTHSAGAPPAASPALSVADEDYGASDAGSAITLSLLSDYSGAASVAESTRSLGSNGWPAPTRQALWDAPGGAPRGPNSMRERTILLFAQNSAL